MIEGGRKNGKGRGGREKDWRKMAVDQMVMMGYRMKGRMDKK